jgi:hypothetical protein
MAQAILKHLQDAVRARARELCEYCHTNERWQYVPFTIDHVIPTNLGGTTTLENLALACFHCNRHKSNKIEIFDEETAMTVALFNPRTMQWSQHFRWSRDFLTVEAMTNEGRITIQPLDLNRERLNLIRAEDVVVKRHPPRDDLA